MFNFLKKSDKRNSVGTRLSFKDKLAQTKKVLSHNLYQLLSGKSLLTDAVIAEIETILLQGDIGVQTNDYIIDMLKTRMKLQPANTQAELYPLLKDILGDLLMVAQPLDFTQKQPFVLLIVGVNGAGKTTTIGKLAKQFQTQGKSVMLAAGDTFRAAATEQLQVWGQRNNITVVAGQNGSDSAALAYDALNSAKKQPVDLLLIDTAGRLHTQQNLMAELQKIKRSLTKNTKQAPHETMLVLDGNIGSNARHQAQEFHQAVGLDSVSMTKLDGSAKGGILFSICHELKLPIRYIGLGEGIDDLHLFDKTKFIQALFR